VLVLILKPTFLFASVSRTRPTAIDASVWSDAHGRIAVMVDTKAGGQIACSAF
jgi:hypothetical protein